MACHRSSIRPGPASSRSPRSPLRSPVGSPPDAPQPSTPWSRCGRSSARMDSLMQDLRFAYRSLRRTPGFTLTVIVMMALGIGVNAMIYSLMRAILFTDLPFADPERVVSISTYDARANGRGETMSMPDARDLRDQSRTLATVGLWTDTDVFLAGGDAPQRVKATFGSDDLLTTLGVQPRLGRWFTPEECRLGASFGPVVIGARVWRERFASDPDV